MKNNMLKVFLVEDEAIIREGLRDIIPWQQYGCALVGDAGDGEQALPMIRSLRPDVLITDIRMPFMDGLALSRLVMKEFPAMKIIIISGYDDFEYARQAIRIGAFQYLLKPVTKSMLIKTLDEVREKIKAEREQENYLEKFRSEVQEYEQFSRRLFFEQIVEGQLSVEEIYERAAQLNISIHAQCYNLILYSLQADTDKAWQKGETADIISGIRDRLTQFFMLYPEYLMFRWNLTTCAVLIRGDRAQIDALTERCAETIRDQAQPYEQEVRWYVAIGQSTERLSALPACFDELSHVFSCRHLSGSRHILTKESVERLIGGEDESSLKNLDISRINPELLQGFLKNGQIEEVEDFVGEYLDSLHDAMSSRLFGQYLMLNARFTVISYIEGLGHSQEEAQALLPGIQMISGNVSEDELKEYICSVLRCALEQREQESKSRGHHLVRQAVEYIDRNFADENMSLKEVAGYTNVSANYFSAVFSQEMRQTFVEYLTSKRMERARELLRRTDMRSAEVAAEVGYKDPHYFSFVFRKTQGCTPRDYRAGGKRE